MTPAARARPPIHWRTRLAPALALLAAAACAKAPPVLTAFTADPTDVASGDPVTLSWSVRGAERLVLDPDVGDVTGTAVTVTPRVDTIYQLTASNAGGAVVREAKVTVHVRAPPAQIYSFTADPPQAAPGGAVTLSWLQAGATTLSLDHGAPPLSPTDSSVVVHPTVSTLYPLSAMGPADKVPATAQVTVRVVPLPAITAGSFRQTPPGTVPLGSQVVLSWDSDGQAFLLDDGAGFSLDAGSLRSAAVRPLASGTWTLTAFGPTGRATAALAIAVSGAPAASLAYADPPLGAEVLRLVKDPGAPPGPLVLLLQTAQPVTLNALALNLPLDGAAAGSRDGGGRVALDPAPAASLPSATWRTISAGFDVDTAQLDPGGGATSPAAALARLPAAGPLAGVLTVGLAQKPQAQCARTGAACQGAKAGEVALPAGAVLARLRLLPRPSGGAGPVIDPAQLMQATSGYRALVRGAAGSSTNVAVGTLTALP